MPEASRARQITDRRGGLVVTQQEAMGTVAFHSLTETSEPADPCCAGTRANETTSLDYSEQTL